MKNKKYFQIDVSDRMADINIYGEITSWRWFENDVSAYSFKQQIDELDVDTINVYINSPGGEVGEALAIYSALKRHKAKVNTFCDGFACSAASIIFCAGDVRTMGQIAMLMIHNCMSYVGYANSAKMRKAADDNDKINQSSIEAYKAVSKLDEDEIKELMDAETWITAQEALDYGFATEIADDEDDAEGEIKQSVNPLIHQMILDNKKNDSEQTIKAVMDKLDSIAEQIKNVPDSIKDYCNEKPKGSPNQTNGAISSFKNFFNNLK